MSTQTLESTRAPIQEPDARDRVGTEVSVQGFPQTLRSEWIKFTSVRSTVWSLVAMGVLGVGLTVAVCAMSASWLASAGADESPGSFVTWGMMFAQITAVVLGAMVVTSEYGTGLVRATFAATPHRGRVLAAKATVLAGSLFVVGLVTAAVGYFAGNAFLSAAGVGVPLDSDGLLRSLFGSGLYVAGLGLFSAAVGLLVRHTAAAISIVLGVVYVVGQMVFLIPTAAGEWLGKLMPGNAGSAITTPVSFSPDVLGPWTGLGVFVAETALLGLLGWVMVHRRDA